MREIKFRAWDENNKMTYFKLSLDIIQRGVNAYCYLREAINKGLSYKLMQFTCLKDKDGTEIYEGDIVQVDNHILEDGEDESFDVITQCKWDKGMFILEDQAFGHWTRQLRHSPERLKVIGNIYENPELLEN